MSVIRMPNVFERMLLVIGVLIIIVGYGLIYKVMRANPSLTWDSLIVIFLWLILIVLVILAAVAENMKEELKTVIENQFSESKILKRLQK